MILKDMIIEDQQLFVEIAGFVIIKRNGKYYEIAVRMRHDYKPSVDESDVYISELRLMDYKELIKRFMRECNKVNIHYKLSGGKLVNGFGLKIHEEEFVF